MEIEIYSDLEAFKHMLDTIGFKEVDGDNKYSENTYFVQIDDNEETGEAEYQLIWTPKGSARNEFKTWDNWLIFNAEQKRVGKVN